eukprot:symbB.v1.2.006108.t2/scaffold364.1/size219240/5
MSTVSWTLAICWVWFTRILGGFSWTHCALNEVLDLGREEMDSFWQDYVLEWSSLHIDSGASLEDARFFMKWTYILTQTEEVLKSVASDCLFGVLTVILQSLPAIDYEKGRNETQEILDIADDLVAIFEQQPDRDDIWSSASSAGWDVDALVRTTRLYRRMLQPIAGEKCQLKVYVYPPPKLSSAPRSLLQTEAGYFGAMSAGMPLQCLFGMYGTELLFHQWFLREAAACRSTPEDADLFYVPSYFKCIEVLNYFDRFNHQENEASILFNQTLQYVKDASGNWWRNGGADHIFLFSWGRHPCRIPAWREPLQSVIQLQVEDHCEDLNFQSPEASFSRWKDVIIPGHIDEWRVAELRRSNRPLQRRDVLVSFHGRYAGNTDSYGNVTVRSKIMKHLSGLPGVSVGGFVEEYHTLMGRSRFCLAPRGITPWTIHLFVSMLAGCIPVILSDDLEAPFQDLLDWSSFSIKWPTDRVEDLYEYLKSLPADLVLDMKSAVDRNSCWFDYYSQNPGCEPFSAVTTILQKRVAQRPGFAGKFWAPLVGHGHRLVAGFFIKTVLNEDRVSLLREPVDDSEAEHVLQILCSIVLVLLVCLVLAMFTSSDDISFAGAMGAIPSIPKRPREKYAAKIHPPVERSLTQLTEQMVAINEDLSNQTSSSSWKRQPKAPGGLQDFAANPFLKPPTGESWVSSPCALEIDGFVHLWVGISTGIMHLVSKDGLSKWKIVELTVESPGATRPHVSLTENNVVYLFYEQTEAPKHGFTSSKVKLTSARLPSVAFRSEGAWLWSTATEAYLLIPKLCKVWHQVLQPELEWEKVQTSRVGNPFVVYNPFRDQWLLYYSASSVFRRKDSKSPPSLYIGIAAAPAVEGPYQRLNEKPFFGTSEGVPQVIGTFAANAEGAGSFKMIKGFDVLDYDAEAGEGRRLLALESRVTRSKEGSVSSIALLASADGFTWSVIDPAFLAPTAAEKHINSFDTMIRSSDPDHVLIYYDARNDFEKSMECIGASRVPVSYLESIACTSATRVRSMTSPGPKLEPEGDAHHSTLPHAATSAVPLSAQGPTGLRPVQTWPAVDQSLEEVDRHYVSSPQSSLNSVRFTSESMVPPTRGLVVPGGSECVLAVRLPTSSVFLEAQVDVMDLTGQAVLAATLRLSNQQARDPAVVLKPTSATPNGNVANQELARCYANRGSDGEIGIDICKALLMNILQRHSLTSRTSRHLVTMDVSADLVAFAEELADAAGNVIRKYWRKPVEIESKHEPGRPVAESPVTLADREAEEAMRKLIEARLVLSVLKRPRIARQSIHRREAAMAIRRVPPTLPSALKARYLARALRRFSSDLFLPSDQFAQRHLGPLPADVQEMCKVIGVKDLSELMEKAIPASVRREQPMELPDGQLGESGSLALLKEMLSKNVIAKNYIGMGYHGSHVPGPILRNLLENPGWYTAYTPYQAEISQGRLESLVNYQTLVCELTGMEVANASLLDEGTAAAEAMAMIARAVNSKAKNQFFISDSVHPQSIDCIKTRAKYFGMELVIGDHTTTDFASMDKLCGALVQYPDTRGRYFKFEGIADALHKNGAYFIVAADPLSLVLAKPPSEIGADVVVGSMQRFGVPMWFGGPSAAYLATSKKQVRRMPGRLIGESLDRLGNPAYRLTLQTREQHIRLDKATSNVCTAQVLLANMAGMYAVYHRKDGLKKIAARVHGLAQLFAKEAQAAGLTLASTTAFFDTVSFETSKAKAIAQELEKQKMNVRVLDDKTLAASFDETHLEADVMALTLPGLVLSSSRRSLIPFPQRLS